MGKKYKILIISCFSIALVLLFLLHKDVSAKQIQVTLSGNVYSSKDEAYIETIQISISGDYRDSKIFGKGFHGEIDFSDNDYDLQRGNIDINMSQIPYEPIISEMNGHHYTSRIHSILPYQENSYVILLYNQYEQTDNRTTGYLDLNNPFFICVGNITREKALQIISDQYK